MIYVSDLQKLVSEWLERMNNSAQPLSYRDAIGECIYDLNNVINKSIEDELDYHESVEVDNWLSTIEAHDIAI